MLETQAAFVLGEKSLFCSFFLAISMCISKIVLAAFYSHTVEGMMAKREAMFNRET